MPRQDFWYNHEAEKIGALPTGSKGGGFIFLSAQTPVDLETGVLTVKFDDLPEEGVKTVKTGHLLTDARSSRIRCQTWRVYDNISKILAKQRISLDQIVRQRIYLRYALDAQQVEDVMPRFFRNEKPATGIWAMNDCGLADNIDIQVEIIALDPNSGLAKENIHIPALEILTAPYPQAVKVGQFLFTSALTGVDPVSGRLVTRWKDLRPDIPHPLTGYHYSDSVQEAIKVQLLQMSNNLERILASVGGTKTDVIHVFQLRCISTKAVPDFHAARFERWPKIEEAPTSSGFCANKERILADPQVIQSNDYMALLPGKYRIERGIELGRGIAPYYPIWIKAGPLWVNAGEIPGDSKMNKAYLRFSDLPDAGRFFTHGRIHKDIEMAQAWFVYNLMEQLLQHAGLKLSDVVMQQVYMRDVSWYPAVERIAFQIFKGNLPPTSVIPVYDLCGLPDRTGMLEIEFIAATE